MTLVLCLAVAGLFLRQRLAAGDAASRRAAEATRVAEARFAALIRATLPMAWRLSSRRQILRGSVNRTTRPAGALAARGITEFVATEDRERLHRFIATELAAAGSSATAEVRVPRGREKPRVVEILGANLEAEPAVAGLLLNLRDVTERRTLEDKLRQMALHDPLTLLPNRALFRDRAEHALAVGSRVERRGRCSSTSTTSRRSTTLRSRPGDRVRAALRSALCSASQRRHCGPARWR